MRYPHTVAWSRMLDCWAEVGRSPVSGLTPTCSNTRVRSLLRVLLAESPDPFQDVQLYLLTTHDRIRILIEFVFVI